MNRPDVDQTAVAPAFTDREGERMASVLGFSACAGFGFAVGLLVEQGMALSALVASLLVTAGVSGWVLRGIR